MQWMPSLHWQEPSDSLQVSNKEPTGLQLQASQPVYTSIYQDLKGYLSLTVQTGIILNWVYSNAYYYISAVRKITGVLQEVQVAMPVTVILLAPHQKSAMNLMVHVNVMKVLEAGNVMNARQTSMEIPMLNATLVIVILWIPSLSNVITKQENVPVSKVCLFWIVLFLLDQFLYSHTACMGF